MGLPLELPTPILCPLMMLLLLKITTEYVIISAATSTDFIITEENITFEANTN